MSREHSCRRGTYIFRREISHTAMSSSLSTIMTLEYICQRSSRSSPRQELPWNMAEISTG